MTMLSEQPKDTWSAPCQHCRAYVDTLFSLTDIVEYTETSQFEVRWECPMCHNLWKFEVTIEGARWGLSRGSRHVVVTPVAPEKHSGGPPIDEDVQIEFWQAWQPGMDESPEAVYDRLNKELAETRRQIEMERANE